MRLSLACLLAIVVFSCGKPMTVAEYKAWFNDPENGFLKEKVVNDLKFSVQLRPVELMILKEMKQATGYSASQIDSLKNSYGSSLYFLMEVTYENTEKMKKGDLVQSTVKNYNEYVEHINQLSFELDDNVILVAGDDTIRPSLYHYERGYELGKKQSFLFAFPFDDDKNNEQVSFIYNDEVFQTGVNVFRFSVNNEIPEFPILTK